MGCAGSLTSCPGPKTTAVAAMCNSGYRKSLHFVHLLFFPTAMAMFILQYFLVFHLLTEKSNSTDPCWPVIRVHLQLILVRVYAGNVDMSNIPNVFCWHGPNNSCSRDKIHFYTLWTEEVFCIYSLLNSLSRIKIYWHIRALRYR